MEHKNLPPFWLIFGVGAVVIASLWFVLASLAGDTPAAEPAATLLIPTWTPVATSTSVPLPTAVSVLEPSSPLPTLALETAPDFTLEQFDGSTFTLSEQLAQGPVVLVFFQRCSS